MPGPAGGHASPGQCPLAAGRA
nr:hypothetical protein [Paracoccus versutus]